MHRSLRALGAGAVVVTVLTLTVDGVASASPATAASPNRPGSGWIGTWGASPVGADASVPDGFAGRSVRNVVRVSTGGSSVRVRLSNAFGTQPLSLAHATVAVSSVPNTAAAVRSTIRTLRFGRRTDPVIPVGAEAISDEVTLPVSPGAKLLVSVLTSTAAAPTYHQDAQQLSYVADGDHTADASGGAFTQTVASWYYVSEVDVRGPAPASVVALGDSITDGYQSTIGADHRWPDFLADRLQRTSRPLGVVNEGISANKVLLDASPASGVGPSAVSRVQRDVISRGGVRTVVLLEGINDIDDPPQQTDVTRIENGLAQIAAQVHGAGLRILVGTLTPYEGSPVYTATREAERRALNRWIRTSRHFDGVVDFDAALRDPADPARMRPGYDSGDHLHPSDAGYRVMASVVPLNRL